MERSPTNPAALDRNMDFQYPQWMSSTQSLKKRRDNRKRCTRGNLEMRGEMEQENKLEDETDQGRTRAREESRTEEVDEYTLIFFASDQVKCV